MYLSTRRATFNHFQGCTLWQLNSCGRSSSSPYQERNRTLPALSHAWPMRGCQIRCPWPWWIATPSLTSDLRPELSVILRCGSQKTRTRVRLPPPSGTEFTWVNPLAWENFRGQGYACSNCFRTAFWNTGCHYQICHPFWTRCWMNTLINLNLSS